MTTGLPVGVRTPSPGRKAIRFDHLPRLRELLQDGGKPGIVYAQVCVKNLLAANQREEDPPHLTLIERTDYYEVTGPSGTTAMALVGSGQPIPGASPSSGERLFFTDGEAAEECGFQTPKYVIWFSAPRPQPKVEVASPEPPPPRLKRKYTRRGTKRVRGRYTDAMDVTKETPHGALTQEPQS